MTTGESSAESPGAATWARSFTEKQITRDVLAATHTFLTEVEADAVNALSAPTLVAAGTRLDAEPFSFGQVLRRWERAIHRIVASVTRHLDPGTEAGQRYLASVEQRLNAATLPGEAYSSTRAVLLLSVEQGWDHHATHAALADALSPATPGTVVDGATRALTSAPHQPSWEATARRIARTEATSAYGHATLTRLASEGFTRKRWVGYHDRLVRPTHETADGQTVPVMASFLVGGWSMMHPGDPNAPLSETANCRCVMVGVD